MNVANTTPSNLTFDMIKEIMPQSRPYEALFVKPETFEELRNRSNKGRKIGMPMSDQISSFLGVNIYVKANQKTSAFMMQSKDMAEKYLNDEITEDEVIQIIEAWNNKT